VIQRVLGGDSTDDDDDSGRRRLLNFVAQQEDNSSSSEDSSDGFDFHLGVYLFEFQLCPDFHLTIVTLIDNACPKPRGSNTVEKSLTLQVPYDAFTANEGLSAQLTSSLAADLAVRMGVSTDCVTSVELTESDSVIADPLAGSGFAVTSDSGEGRRQSSASSATTLTFTIQGTNNAQTTAASLDFDEQKSSGTLALASSADLLESSCASCGSTTSMGAPPSDLELASSSGSSGSSGSSDSTSDSTSSSSSDSLSDSVATQSVSLCLIVLTILAVGLN